MMLPILALATMLLAPADGQEATVSRARELYNMHDFDAAIQTAEAARRVRGAGDAASLIIARAYLERFRETQDVRDLEQSRGLLAHIQPPPLSPRARVEWLARIGVPPYLDGEFGPAG